MSNKTKKQEPKEEVLYTITLNKHQLSLISDACDNAGRIYRGIPETCNIFDNVLVEQNENMDESFWHRRKMLRNVLVLLRDVLNPTSRTDRTDTEHVLHDMYQVIRNVFHKEYEEETGNKNDWSVSSSIHRTSSMNLIKVQKLKPNNDETGTGK